MANKKAWMKDVASGGNSQQWLGGDAYAGASVQQGIARRAARMSRKLGLLERCITKNHKLALQYQPQPPFACTDAPARIGSQGLPQTLLARQGRRAPYRVCSDTCAVERMHNITCNHVAVCNTTRAQAPPKACRHARFCSCRPSFTVLLASSLSR